MKPHNDNNVVSVSVKAGWQTVRDLLEKQGQQIYEEIKNYPKPIPACDLQFNYLLEQRTGISDELDRFDEVFQKSLACGDRAKMLTDFIKSCEYLKE